MSGLPLVVLSGTVVAEPELRFTPSGKAVCEFRVACNDRRRDAAGNWTDGDATFLSVTSWSRMAENVAESVRKGHRVDVVGRLRQSSYEDRDGATRISFDVVAETVAVSLLFNPADVKRIDRSPAQAGQERREQ